MTTHPHHPEPPSSAALFTDLYELTMCAAYHAEGMDGIADFELFFRDLPRGRGFVVAAGLEAVLDHLERFRFTEDDLAFLAGQERFSAAFLAHLGALRFEGDVDAVPEGTPVFPGEPLVRVSAPIEQAQLVETLVLNQIHFQSVAASKAARVVAAAGGRTVVDFGSRRAPGVDAAVAVARAAYLVGADGTSNVLAGRRHGIPLYGTMAHSYVEAHDDEERAFEAFAAVHPGATLLVDTYDTLAGVRKVIGLCQRHGWSQEGWAIRLDSGELAALARESRGLLDRSGLPGVRIFASGGLDEHGIRALLDAGAPIDGFGVGTAMAVSDDAPALDMAYKLVAYDGRPRMKLSSGKATYPGPKQVFRVREGDELAGDTIARAGEELPGEPLLEPVMRGGRRLHPAREPLQEGRARALREIARLPARLLDLEPAEGAAPVTTSRALQRDADELSRTLGDRP